MRKLSEMRRDKADCKKAVTLTAIKLHYAFSGCGMIFFQAAAWFIKLHHD